MIYSEEHNFIFIHIVKTGGQSLYGALSVFAPQREKTIGQKLKAILPLPCGLSFFPPHAPADWVRKRIGKGKFDRAYSFAVVRNLFDRLVSQYEYIRQSPKHHRYDWIQKKSFADYVEALSRESRDRSQAAMVCDKNGRLLVSEIFRFENFGAILPAVCSKVGLREVTIEHRNRSVRRNFGDYYDQNVEQRVRETISSSLSILTNCTSNKST